MNWDPGDYCEIERPWRMNHVAKIALACFAVLLGVGLACADQEVTVKPGRLVKLQTKLVGKKILWNKFDDIDLIDDSSGKWAMALFPNPGTFKVFVVTAKGDEPLTETITVTVEGVPPPIPPGPGPDPKPPGPVDDLTAKIGTAWQMEFDPAKATHAKALAALYRYGRARMDDSATWGERNFYIYSFFQYRLQ
jgi:hypothetical protein